MLLEIACLVLWVRASITRYAIAAGTISLISSFAVVFLVMLEHTRSVRPSTITSIYLLTSIVADAVQLRTISLRHYSSSLTSVLSAVLAFKISLLILESWSKKKYIKPTFIEYGPEDTTGVFAGSILWWLNSLFWRGNGHVLTSNDLFPLDQELRSVILKANAIKAWKRCKAAQHLSRH